MFGYLDSDFIKIVITIFLILFAILMVKSLLMLKLVDLYDSNNKLFNKIYYNKKGYVRTIFIISPFVFMGYTFHNNHNLNSKKIKLNNLNESKFFKNYFNLSYDNYKNFVNISNKIFKVIFILMLMLVFINTFFVLIKILNNESVYSSFGLIEK